MTRTIEEVRATEQTADTAQNTEKSKSLCQTKWENGVNIIFPQSQKDVNPRYTNKETKTWVPQAYTSLN